jgi:hypothetical protein
MSYAQQIGETLAETLNELFALEDLNIPLNEIRDLSTLQSHMSNVEAKYGKKHAKYKALQNLHAKKEAAETRKAERHAKIKSRQEFHAKNFGYTPVKGSKRGQWVHKDTGHTLSFGGDRSWSHMKSGAKRAKGGNATPIRDLRNHLSKLHEGVEFTGEELNEIRSLEKLRMQANRALLDRDPRAQEKLMRALQLQKRKRNLMMGEDEIMELLGFGKPKMDRNEIHKVLTDHGFRQDNNPSSQRTEPHNPNYGTEYSHPKHDRTTFAHIPAGNKGWQIHHNGKVHKGHTHGELKDALTTKVGHLG